MNYEIEFGGRKRALSIQPDGEAGIYRFQLDGETVAADATLVQPGVLSVLIDNKSYCILFDPRPGEKAVVLDDERIPYRIGDPRSLRAHASMSGGESGARAICATMPGRIIRILVEPGTQVEEQQGLIVIEAMKMQNELKSPKAGTVARVVVGVGATVSAGEELMVIE